MVFYVSIIAVCCKFSSPTFEDFLSGHSYSYSAMSLLGCPIHTESSNTLYIPDAGTPKMQLSPSCFRDTSRHCIIEYSQAPVLVCGTDFVSFIHQVPLELREDGFHYAVPQSPDSNWPRLQTTLPVLTVVFKCNDIYQPIYNTPVHSAFQSVASAPNQTHSTAKMAQRKRRKRQTKPQPSTVTWALPPWWNLKTSEGHPSTNITSSINITTPSYTT